MTNNAKLFQKCLTEPAVKVTKILVQADSLPETCGPDLYKAYNVCLRPMNHLRVVTGFDLHALCLEHGVAMVAIGRRQALPTHTMQGHKAPVTWVATYRTERDALLGLPVRHQKKSGASFSDKTPAWMVRKGLRRAEVTTEDQYGRVLFNRKNPAKNIHASGRTIDNLAQPKGGDRVKRHIGTGH